MNASMSKYEAEHVLGLTGSYTRADVRKAQGKLSKAFHPDVAERHGMTKEQAQERMLAVNNAFKVLMTLFADDPKRVVACDEPVGPAWSYSGSVHVRPDAAREAADEAQRRWEEAKKEAFSGASVSSTTQEAVHTQASFRDAASTGDVADADARRPLTFNEVVRQQTGVDPSCTKSAEQKREEDLEYRLMNNKLFRFATSLPFWWILSVVVVYSTLRNVGQFYDGWESHLLDAGFTADPLAHLVTIVLLLLQMAVILFGWCIGPMVRAVCLGLILGFSAPKKVSSKDEQH